MPVENADKRIGVRKFSAKLQKPLLEFPEESSIVLDSPEKGIPLFSRSNFPYCTTPIWRLNARSWSLVGGRLMG